MATGSSSLASAGIAIGAGAASGAAVGGPVGAAVGAATAAVKVGISDLTQHTARLKDAKGENQALDALIPAFDADIAAIAQAFSSGAASAQLCITALFTVDGNIFTNLWSLSQQKLAGIAWGGPTTSSLGSGNNPSYHADCNSSCTAGCCVYLNDLRPAIFGRSGLTTTSYPQQQTNGVILGLIEIIQSGGGVLKVIPISPPPNKAYGSFARAAYTINVTPPPVQSSILSTVSEMTGTGSITLPDGKVVTSSGANSSASASGISALSLPLVIVLVVGVLLLGLVFIAKR